MEISKFAKNIEPSATLAAGAKAKEIAGKGIEVFDFSLGEPDFVTPEHICNAAKKAMADGHTRYTPAQGIPQLKKAIADYHQQMHGLNYGENQVCVSNGAKHAIYTALCAVLNPGDEVIIPTPYWVSYSELVKMTGATAVLVQTTAESGFLMSPEQLRSAITPKSKLLMLNSPSNPTGSTYSPSQLAALAEVVLSTDLLVLSDEIYERLIFGATQFKAFASIAPAVADRTLTINGVSKTYAMTGWRIGWTLGPANVIKAMADIQSQQTSNPSSISQYAALAALKGDQDCVEKMKVEFAKRRDFVVQRINAIPGLSLVPPTGAFYAFFNISSYFGRQIGGVSINNSNDFCMALLDQAHVNLVLGSAFGANDYARMSYATSMATIQRGLDALEAWLKTAK